jgi:CheY-like chemotaxis protein
MHDLANLRVLVVEDEGPVALLIEDMLLDLRCEVVASAADAPKASQLAGTLQIDLALLDLNLNGQSALPVARILHERAIPLLFISGYGEGAVTQDFASYPILAKPFTFAALREKMLLAVAANDRRELQD